MRETKVSFCRFCHAFCGIKVDVEDGRVVKVIGDVENPMYHGFTCVKGRALPEQHNHPDRLLHTMKRQPDGAYEPVAVGDAMDEIAARLSDIIRESGPRSVALYAGTFSFHYPLGNEMGRAFMKAIGSNMRFSSGSIDQPGKGIARALHGTWSAGPQPFSEADTWILVGANPTISMWGGIPQYDPAKRLREAKANGMRLIVIDPRRTEAAANADLFLQPKPGEDPTILAGILRVILTEGLHDADFVADEVEGFDALVAAVEPFTPRLRRAPGPRAGRPGGGRGPDVRRRRGAAASPPGPGRTWLPAARSPSTSSPASRPSAAGGCAPASACRTRTCCSPSACPRPRPTRRCRRGASASSCACGTSATTPVACRRPRWPTRSWSREKAGSAALICLGGNPMAAWPDQLKTYEAMQALDLNVTLDIKMSATAKLADYVVAPKLSLEAPTTTHAERDDLGLRRGHHGLPRAVRACTPRWSSNRRPAARSSRSGSCSTASRSGWASSSASPAWSSTWRTRRRATSCSS